MTHYNPRVQHASVEDLLGAAISKLELRHAWAKVVLTYVLKRLRWESSEKAAWYRVFDKKSVSGVHS